MEFVGHLMLEGQIGDIRKVAGHNEVGTDIDQADYHQGRQRVE
jgi:hypothetical protein